MASASDNFNRSNENPLSDGGNWTTGPGASSDIQLVNNRVRNVTTQTESVARRGSPTFTADHAAEIAVVTRNSTEDYGGPAVRINSSDADHYFLRPAFAGTSLQIRRVDDTGTLAGTTLGASFGTFALNDVLRLEAAGSLLIAKQNGNLLATRVDTTYAAGQPGISLWNHYTDVADLELDTWSAEDLTKTRLYLPSSGAAPINFAFASGWEKTSEADRISAVSAKSNTALTDKTCSENVSTTPYDVLARQYCYGPLAAQTIAGTVRGIIRVLESNAQADFRAQLVIKVMASDGSTVRGTLLDFDTQALKNEFPTTAASRMFPLNWDTVALTSVNAQAGDYLVIEIGIRSHNSSTTNRTATFRFGDPTSGSDFTEVEGTTTDNVPWLEFSEAIALQPDGSDGTSAGVATVTGVGASVAQTAGSGAGVATPSGAGSSIAQAEGDADGIAAASGAGAAVTPADGTSAGQASAAGDAQAIAAGAGQSDGSAAASGVSGAIKGSEGASAGAAQAAGETQAIAGAAGDAAGQAAASGAGAALVQAEGDADGAATIQAAGASIAQTEGVSQGQATAQGQGEDAAAGGSTGTAAGAATASGEGAAIVQSDGDSDGAAVASGAGAAIKTGAGSAHGQAQADAEAALIAQAEAIAAAAAESMGAGSAIAQAEGTSAGQATATAESEAEEPLVVAIPLTVTMALRITLTAKMGSRVAQSVEMAKEIRLTVHI